MEGFGIGVLGRFDNGIDIGNFRYNKNCRLKVKRFKFRFLNDEELMDIKILKVYEDSTRRKREYEYASKDELEEDEIRNI